MPLLTSSTLVAFYNMLEDTADLLYKVLLHPQRENIAAATSIPINLLQLAAQSTVVRELSVPAVNMSRTSSSTRSARTQQR